MATSDTLASNYKVICNFRVTKRSRRKLNDPPEAADVLERFGGAATTIAASVPKELIDESAFVPAAANSRDSSQHRLRAN